MRKDGIAVLAMGLVMLIGATASVKADPKDYRFEAVQTQVPAAENGSVKVQLVHVPDGKPVPNAILFQPKLEMIMSGMAPMGTKVSSVTADGTGVYVVNADLSMAGPWTLTLSAKIQGEPATITGTVPFVAKSH